MEYTLTLSDIAHVTHAVRVVSKHSTGHTWVPSVWSDSVNYVTVMLEVHENVLPLFEVASFQAFLVEIDAVLDEVIGLDEEAHTNHPRWPRAHAYAIESLPALTAMHEAKLRRIAEGHEEP
jgi:hypothetical protein